MSASVRRRLLLSTALLVALTGGAKAQDPASDQALACADPATCPAEDTVALDTITVSPTKTDAAPIAALGGVSVVRLPASETAAAHKATDLLRAVPGVATPGKGDDAGTAVNVRGLQNFGRVAVTVDGARQNYQQTGHGPDGVFFLDPALIDTATVIRGPIANVYGSGAIGGVVSFETKDPSDFLREGERWAASVTGGIGSNGTPYSAGSTAAYRISDGFAVLGSLNTRGRNAYDDGGGAEVFNSGDDAISGMLKAEVTPDENNTFTAGWLANRFDYDTGDEGATQYGTEVWAQTATARWRYANPDDRLFEIDASVYWTGTDKDEDYLSGVNAGAERSFGIDTYGLDLSNTSRVDTGPFAHALTIGVDAFKDDVTTEDTVGTGDLFTPSGERSAYGGFLQDRITYSNWLEVIGGLRFDAYEFSGTDSDGDSVEGDGSRVSPKIAIGVKPFEETVANGLQFYGSYAEGYRAPSITETLVSGVHPGSFQFDFLPNPNLAPETAHNFELGINYSRDDLFTEGDRFRLKASAFRNEVDDYIDAVFAFNPAVGRFQYQYDNVASARLQGLELEATYDMGFAFAGIAASMIRGDNETDDTPLSTIPADRIVSTLGFRFLEDKVTVGAQWEAVAAQDRVPDGTPESDAYNVVNLFATYEPREDLVLGVEVQNLFDEEYTEFLNEDAEAGLTVMFTLSARLGG